MHEKKVTALLGLERLLQNLVFYMSRSISFKALMKFSTFSPSTYQHCLWSPCDFLDFLHALAPICLPLLLQFL